VRYLVSGWSVVLLSFLLVGCSGGAPGVRQSTAQYERCVDIPGRDERAGATSQALNTGRTGLKTVLASAPAGTLPAEPLAPPPTLPLRGLPGDGWGNGIPRGTLRLVPEGGSASEWVASGAAGETVVLGGAVIACPFHST
jgi:hypothetical protein